MTIPDTAAAPVVAPAPAAPPVVAQVVVLKHHALVRLSHWMTVVVLIGLVMSGLSIYWASPVFVHAPDPRTGSREALADLGLRLGHSKTWVYDKFGLGSYALADALQLHWLFAYLLMLAGVLYLAGLMAGRGWRGLMPRRGQVAEAIRMQWYYLGVVPAKLLRRPWSHPPITTKYNGLQRTAYSSMSVAGLLIVASGWAMHKPAQLHWLERMFGSYDGARIVHFVTMCAFLAFVVPHVVLAAADGWDTMRSMVVGWSERVAPQVAYAGTVVAADTPADEPAVLVAPVVEPEVPAVAELVPDPLPDPLSGVPPVAAAEEIAEVDDDIAARE